MYCFVLQIKFLKMEMEKKTKIIKDLQQEVWLGTTSASKPVEIRRLANSGSYLSLIVLD